MKPCSRRVKRTKADPVLRFFPILTVALLLGPVLAGLLATVLPAFGWFPPLGGDAFTLEPWRTVLAEPGLARSAWHSLFSGLLATALSLGIVALFLAGWVGTPSFRRFTALVSPLLALPHAAAAFALAFLVAPSGWIARLVSPDITGWQRPPDILVVHDEHALTLTAALVAKEVPFLLLVALAALPQTGWEMRLRLATSLGYGRVRAFLLTVWPALYPQIRLAVFAVLAYSTANVEVAAILGPLTPPTLAVRLVDWMGDPDLTRRFAACAGALLQLGLTVLAGLLWIGGERLGRLWLARAAPSGRRTRAEGLARSLGAASVALCAIAILLGLALLALWSVATFWRFPAALPDGLTWRTWNRVWPGMSAPFLTTVSVGFASVAAALLLAVGCLEREWRVRSDGGSRALLVVYLPLIVPQVAFVFGLQLFFLWARIDASWGALVLVHLVFVMPYVFLSLSDPWRAWDTRYASVAHGLGRGEGAVLWRLRLPMLVRPLLVAGAVGFAVSVGQYLPTVLVGAGRLTTITTEAVALGSGGDRRVIGAWAVIQMVLPLLAFTLAALVPAILFRHRRALRTP